jgi:hypothetical protein
LPDSLLPPPRYLVSEPDCRLRPARTSFLETLYHTYRNSPEREEILDACVNSYIAWRDSPDYLIFREELQDDSIRFRGGKARKRGNDIDLWKLNKRFQEAEKMFDSILRFERREHSTFRDNTFFFTLTYDRIEGNLSIGEAWERVSPDYQRYVAWLRRIFGPCAVIRVFSSHADGYPHIHFVITFKDQMWEVKWHRGEDGRRRLRLLRKNGPKGVDPTVEFLASGWKHGFIDVQGVSDTKTVFGYLLGYASGQGVNKEAKKNITGNKSLALNWLFRKRSFAISNPDLIIVTSVTRTKIPSRDPNIRHIDLVAIVKIEFFDRPPPFSIDLEAWSDLKRDVLLVCGNIIEKENEEKRRVKRFSQMIDEDFTVHGCMGVR